MKKLMCALLALAVQGIALAQTDSSKTTEAELQPQNLEDIVVMSTRVSKDAPVAQSNMTKEEIEENNLGVDLPILMDQQQSVVTTTDAGAGVGYTGIRIRGSDPTRINVTVNGVPLNDAESQGVWWVNMPDLASSTNGIQIQRGVGTSTNGAGAFGATINMQTNKISTEPYGEISLGGGSFNTQRGTMRFGTGMMGKWSFDGRLSRISSNGYMDRASANLKSYYLSANYLGDKSLLQFITFAGQERTYQAWYGTPVRYLDTNRTLNPYTYDDEVDNYGQQHYQLHYAYEASKHLTLNTALHYTKGAGYFEQYKGVAENPLVNYGSQESLLDYGLNPVVTSSGDTIANTDLIRRRWLDNDFYGVVASAEYKKDKLQAIVGGGYNIYEGSHFGEIIWAEYASNGSIYEPYYDNDARKTDLNAYAKVNYELKPNLMVFGDMQMRMISYDFLGFNNVLENVDQSVNLTFLNPKIGATYQISDGGQVYGFAGIGNREPNRNDYTQSTPNSRPENETLRNVELGWREARKDHFWNVNFYVMDYQNQLVVTGEYNDVGAAIRENVAASNRYGLEISGGVKFLKKFEWIANLTSSRNKIKKFTEFTDNWDTGGQDSTEYSNTSLAFSPEIIAGSQLKYNFLEDDKYGNAELALITKYVGAQYIDNTENDARKLDAYLVNDLRLSYTVKTKMFKELVFTAMARNILNELYVSNAWVYKFTSTGYDPTPDDPYTNAEDTASGKYNQIGAFPQAGRNFLLGLTLKF